MKKIFFTIIVSVLFALQARTQSVIADPAVNIMNVSAGNGEIVDPFLIPMDSVFELKVPVINYNQANALPSGSCKVKIGLGSKLVLDPTFILSNAMLSNYFSWTAETTGGQVQITGDLIALLPSNFSDTAVFKVKGSMLGNSTVTTNFLVTNHNTNVNLSDENGNNNNTFLPYTIIEGIGGPLPVTFTSFTATNIACSIGLKFHTENEINVDRFEIEVSKDQQVYQNLGSLDASHAGDYIYSFAITNELDAEYLFTRIKSIDLDGQYQYSDVIKVSGKCIAAGKSLLVFPNPAPSNSNYFTIKRETAVFNGTFKISISDMAGKIVHRKELVLNSVNQFRYDHGFLTAGQYIIQIVDAATGEFYPMKWQKK